VRDAIRAWQKCFLISGLETDPANYQDCVAVSFPDWTSLRELTSDLAHLQVGAELVLTSWPRAGWVADMGAALDALSTDRSRNDFRNAARELIRLSNGRPSPNPLTAAEMARPVALIGTFLKSYMEFRRFYLSLPH